MGRGRRGRIMLIGSEGNTYKKLLKEAEDQYLDFPNKDEDFSKDYNTYKSVTVPRYDKHKFFNDQYPEYAEDGGIVNYLINATNGFIKLLERKITDAEGNNDGFDTAYDSYSDNNYDNRYSSHSIEYGAEELLRKEYESMKVLEEDDNSLDIIDHIQRFANKLDRYDISPTLSREVGEDEIQIDTYEIDHYNLPVSIEEDEEVLVNDYWDLDFYTYIEEFKDDKDLFETVFSDTQIDDSDYFSKTYFKSTIHKIIFKNYENRIDFDVIVGPYEFPVVVSKKEIKDMFEDYLQENSITLVSKFVKSDDNSSWEEEEEED
jgi:hypothetical protein